MGPQARVKAEFFAQGEIFTCVGRFALYKDMLLRDSAGDAAFGENIALGYAPQAVCDLSKAAAAYDRWRGALQKQPGGMLRDSQVVTPRREDDVRAGRRGRGSGVEVVERLCVF